ncbi:hypothetical protein [Streptomyces sp. A5-4]|uniref:hypothetical protein n=1 Tax=Streptomyces sp. A5-4 TaxID=3384771 RepID=UPI003DA7DB4A
MSAITFEDLVHTALQLPTASTDGECGTCGAESGEPCTLSCDDRGAQARKEVRAFLIHPPGAQFEEVLKDAREREERDDETPGFFWAWWAVDDEAERRGTSRAAF